MKYIKIEKINVIINLLILVFFITCNGAIAKAEEPVKPANKGVLKPPTLRPAATSSPVKPTSPIIIPTGGNSGIKYSTGPITGSSESRGSGNFSPSPSLSPTGNEIGTIGPRVPPMNKNADYSIKEPLWVDSGNTIGPKVFVDLNSQYYYGWGQVYTVKYTDRMGKVEYIQIELKGLRGNRAAILSVDPEYKNVYEIPINKEYKPMTPDKAIYNSSRIILNNTKKPTCPEYKCIIKNY